MVPAKVAALTVEVMKMMLSSKIKFLTISLLIATSVGSLWGVRAFTRSAIGRDEPSVKEKPVETQEAPVDESSDPRFKVVVACFNDVKDESKNLCSHPCYQHDGTLFKSGKMSCGSVAKFSEIEWTYLGRRGDKDKYRFSRRFPAKTPEEIVSRKEVEFAGKRVIVFEDEAQRIVIEPPRSEDKKSDRFVR